MTDYRTALAPGFIDELKAMHRFTDDEQLAAAIRCSTDDIDALRHGSTPSVVTSLAIAAITGRDRLDFVRRVPANYAA